MTILMTTLIMKMIKKEEEDPQSSTKSFMNLLNDTQWRRS